VLTHGTRELVHLTEVEVVERSPILRRFVAAARAARPHVPVAPHTPLVDFEAIAADHPVFQISRRSGAS
jgi:hypothetical protein